MRTKIEIGFTSSEDRSIWHAPPRYGDYYPSVPGPKRPRSGAFYTRYVYIGPGSSLLTGDQILVEYTHKDKIGLKVKGTFANGIPVVSMMVAIRDNRRL